MGMASRPIRSIWLSSAMTRSCRGRAMVRPSAIATTPKNDKSA
jgi:hypothetical protein